MRCASTIAEASLRFHHPGASKPYLHKPEGCGKAIGMDDYVTAIRDALQSAKNGNSRANPTSEQRL
jgi:hypothetical protein